MRRSLMMKHKGGRLPSGYTEVEYIENTSNAYIDTGYIHKSYNLKTKVVAQWVGTALNAFETLYGFMGKGASYSPRTGIHKWHGYLMFGTNDTNTTSLKMDNNIHTYIQTSKWNGDINGDQVLLDNGNNLPFYTGTAAAGNVNWDTNKLSMYLFARNTNGTASNFANYRIYSFQFWDENNKLIFDMKPCINPQGEVGMYDLVEQKFYKSPNGTPFIAGNPI